jgi:hypothetical protein
LIIYFCGLFLPFNAYLIAFYYVETVQALVPRADLPKYRILRYLSAVLTRVGLRENTDITGDVMQKLIERVLEMKAVSNIGL